MGAFGSILGGIMSIISLFLGWWVAFTFLDGMLAMLWFPIFGILGGFALGALNSRKAKNQPKYKNEYTSYAGMLFAAIVLLAIYYLLFGTDRVEENLPSDSDMSVSSIIILGAVSGILGFFGVGLTVANAIAEE